MAYVVIADMRSATAKEFARPFLLTTAEAPDTDLTDAIARISEQIDTFTGDHFESTTALTMDLTVPGYDETGSRGPTRLHLPKRVRTLTAVSTRDEDGTLTVETATNYRLHSSLNAGGTDFNEDADPYDWIEVVPGKDLSTGDGVWPAGPQAVRVTGNWDWTAVPTDIKKAVAMLAYDHFKPETDNLRRATEWQTNNAAYSASSSTPTGIPPVDETIARYTRPEPVTF